VHRAWTLQGALAPVAAFVLFVWEWGCRRIIQFSRRLRGQASGYHPRSLRRDQTERAYHGMHQRKADFQACGYGPEASTCVKEGQKSLDRPCQSPRRKDTEYVLTDGRIEQYR